MRSNAHGATSEKNFAVRSAVREALNNKQPGLSVLSCFRFWSAGGARGGETAAARGGQTNRKNKHGYVSPGRGCRIHLPKSRAWLGGLFLFIRPPFDLSTIEFPYRSIYENAQGKDSHEQT